MTCGRGQKRPWFVKIQLAGGSTLLGHRVLPPYLGLFLGIFSALPQETPRPPTPNFEMEP